MALDVWSAGADPYDHTELAGNWNKVDVHDHTTGKGVQIPTDGIEDSAITTIKIDDGAITPGKLSGDITSDNLDNEYVHPIGSFMWWWRPSALTAIPSGWVICDGSAVGEANHSFAGGGSITLPNLIDAFPMGVAAANINTSGGSNTKNLQHSHSVNSHTHTINAHSHVVDAHSHTVNEHDHGTGNLLANEAASANVRVADTSPSGNWKVHGVTAPSTQGHTHTISGRTGSVVAGTSNASPNTSSVGLTTNGATATTDNQLSASLDIRPAWIGFLPLLKVKH